MALRSQSVGRRLRLTHFCSIHRRRQLTVPRHLSTHQQVQPTVQLPPRYERRSRCCSHVALFAFLTYSKVLSDESGVQSDFSSLQSNVSSGKPRFSTNSFCGLQRSVLSSKLSPTFSSPVLAHFPGVFTCGKQGRGHHRLTRNKLCKCLAEAVQNACKISV